MKIRFINKRHWHTFFFCANEATGLECNIKMQTETTDKILKSLHEGGRFYYV